MLRFIPVSKVVLFIELFISWFLINKNLSETFKYSIHYLQKGFVKSFYSNKNKHTIDNRKRSLTCFPPFSAYSLVQLSRNYFFSSNKTRNVQTKIFPPFSPPHRPTSLVGGHRWKTTTTTATTFPSARNKHIKSFCRARWNFQSGGESQLQSRAWWKNAFPRMRGLGGEGGEAVIGQRAQSLNIKSISLGGWCCGDGVGWKIKQNTHFRARNGRGQSPRNNSFTWGSFWVGKN